MGSKCDINYEKKTRYQYVPIAIFVGQTLASLYQPFTSVVYMYENRGNIYLIFEQWSRLSYKSGPRGATHM